MTKAVSDDPLLAAIISAAAREPLPLARVVYIVRQVRGAIATGDEDLRGATIALVREGLRRRALVVGTKRTEFEAWNIDVEDAIARIDQEWAKLERDPVGAEIATFATTRSLGWS